MVLSHRTDSSIDVLIVGAGLAGLVCAERLAGKGKKILMIEKRRQIGGNCHDFLNQHGIYVHSYGPHIVHTDSRRVWEYLSAFTEWHQYQHTVQASIADIKIPLPFNLESLERLFPPPLSALLEEKLVRTFGIDREVHILDLRNTDDGDLKRLADFVYENVFLNYNLKQWNRRPEELDPAVSGRLPVRISKDNRYFTEPYQGIPRHGYSEMFRKMIDRPAIQLLLNTDAKELVSIVDGRAFFRGSEFKGPLIYTGMLDELFDFSAGALPCRSVDIVFEDLRQPYYQENAVVNYPNDHSFSRITEFKYFQDNHRLLPHTTVCREYPVAYERGKNNPYYMVQTDESKRMYSHYREMARRIPNLHGLGRLARFQYLDIDEVVESALDLADAL